MEKTALSVFEYYNYAVPYPELFWSRYIDLGSQIQTPKFLKMLD